MRLIALSNRPHSCPLAREEGECNSSLTRSQPPVPSGDPEIEETALLSSFWVPLTMRHWTALGRKRNKRFSTRPSSGGGSGAFTISRRADISIPGSSVSGPLASTLAAWFGRGLDGRGGRLHGAALTHPPM